VTLGHRTRKDERRETASICAAGGSVRNFVCGTA